MASTKEINDYLNRLPSIISTAPLDEKIAYYSIILGCCLIVLWLFLKIVL